MQEMWVFHGVPNVQASRVIMKALLLTMAFRIGPHWNNFEVAGFSSEKWIRNMWHKRIKLAVKRANVMEDEL